MPRLILIFMILSAVWGCAGTEFARVSPTIDEELLTPVPEPRLRGSTVRDLGILIVDFKQSLETANERICGVRDTVIAFGRDIPECPRGQRGE